MKTHRASKNVIGPHLRRLRSSAGLSQADLAARCQRMGWDIDRFTIARIEGGTRWVGDAEVLEIAKALKVNFTLLFGVRP